MKKDKSLTPPANSLEPPLPRALRLFFGIGEFGQQFSVASLQYFLLFFYTDVLKIDPAAAGILILLAKFWDGINDPIMGVIIDTNHSKHGKCRGMLLHWALPAGLFLWLMFNAPDLSPTLKLVYAYVVYFGQDLCYTATGIAYTTLIARITSDPQKRVALNQSRAFISMFAAIFVSSATLGLVEKAGNGNQKLGFNIVMGVYAAIMTLSYLFVFWLTRKYDKQDVATEEEKEAAAREKIERTNLKESIKALLSNNLWRWNLVVCLLYYGASSITSGLLVYYVTHYIGNPSLTGLAGLMSMVSGFLAIGLLGVFTKKIGKHKAGILGLVIAMACMLVRIVTGDRILPLYLGCLLVNGFGLTLFSSLIVPNMMDAIEYGEWKTGVRNEALVMAANSFGTKVGQGLGTSSIAFMLAAVGYNEALAVQSESCVAGIHNLGTLLPLVMYVALIALMIFINKTYDKKMPQIRSELAARKAENV